MDREGPDARASHFLPFVAQFLRLSSSLATCSAFRVSALDTPWERGQGRAVVDVNATKIRPLSLAIEGRIVAGCLGAGPAHFPFYGESFSEIRTDEKLSGDVPPLFGVWKLICFPYIGPSTESSRKSRTFPGR